MSDHQILETFSRTPSSILLIFFLGFFISAVLLFYPVHILRLLASFGLYGLLVYASYLMNLHYTSLCVDLIQNGSSIIQELIFSNDLLAMGTFYINYFCQMLTAIMLYVMFYILPKFSRVVVGFFFILPTLLSFMFVSEYLLLKIPMCCAYIQLAVIVHCIMWNRAYIYFQLIRPLLVVRYYIDRDGLVQCIISFAEAINLWDPFVCFWIMRTVKKAFDLLYLILLTNSDEDNIHTINFEAMKYFISESCNTIFAVIGLASVLSSLVAFIVRVARNLLCLSQPYQSMRKLRNSIFFIFMTLSIQTGISGLEPQDRFDRLYRNVLVFFAAVVQNVWEDVYIALLHLGEAIHASFLRHIKIFISIVLLAGYSSLIVILLLTVHDLSTWVFAVLAFYLENIVKIALAIVIYFLCATDVSFNMYGRLAEYSNDVAILTKISIFVFSLFHFCNGCYILIYESAGVIRLVFMGIHLYFNIYCQFEIGFSEFKKRRRAANVVKLLPRATSEQVLILNDNCPICHQLLHVSRVTRITQCNHYYHERCLIRSLCYTNNCALCNRVILNEAANNVAENHEHQE